MTTEETPEATDAVWAMRRVTWVHRAGFVLFVLAFGAAGMRTGLGSDWPWPVSGWRSGLVTWGAPGLMLATLLAGAVRRAAAVPPHPTLVLGARAAVLPPGRFGRRTRTMRYDTIRSVAWAPSWLGPRARLGVGDDRGAVVYYRSRWFEPGALEAFADRLAARVARADPTGARTAALRARAELAEEAAARRPRATPMLLGLVGVAVSVQWVVAPFDPPHLLWEGATARWLVGDGGWYRLFTGPLLHAGFAHALTNLVMFAVLGPVVEGLLGTARTGIVAAVAALAGSLAIVAFEGARGLVGASGAAYGLVGALLALNSTDRSALPPPYWLSPFLLVALLASVVVIDWLLPLSSSVTHVSGTVGGAVAAWAVRPGSRLSGARPLADVVMRGVAALAALAFGLAGATAWRAAAGVRPEEVARRTALAFAAADAPPLVFEAWTRILAGMPGVRRVDLLELAPIIAARARAVGGEAAETAGEVAWLLGDADAALADYEKAARDDPSPWQLARLAVHRHRAWAAGDIAPGRLGARITVDSAGRATLVLDEASPRPFVVDALVLEAGRLRGALRVAATAGRAGPTGSRVPVLPPAAPEGPGEGRRAVVVAFASSAVDDAATVGGDPRQAGRRRITYRWWYQPVDGAAASLPSPLPD